MAIVVSLLYQAFRERYWYPLEKGQTQRGEAVLSPQDKRTGLLP